jgi:hypothetical protein
MSNGKDNDKGKMKMQLSTNKYLSYSNSHEVLFISNVRRKYTTCHYNIVLAQRFSKLFWFAAHRKTYKKFLVHFVHKIKNILIYFKLGIRIKIMAAINLYTNGFLLIFKIYFHNIRNTPSHLLQCPSVPQRTI